MAFLSYRFRVLIRILFILLNCLLIGIFISKSSTFIYTLFMLFILLGAQVYLLFTYLDKSTQTIARFLDFAKDQNTTLSFQKELKEGAFHDLGQVLDEINAMIREARIDKENHYLYLQYIVQNAGVGLIAYNENGKIELCNEEALHILQLPALYDIRTLESTYSGFMHFITAMSPQDQQIFRLARPNDVLQLTIRCSEFTMQQTRIRLFSFHDIKAELEDKELDSWQKLIRILTHEIMNSLTPINTLATGLSSSFKKLSGNKSAIPIVKEDLTEITEGLDLIAERGSGLMDFIRRYRTITRLPDPVFRKILISGLLSKIKILMNAEAEKIHATIVLEVLPEELEITADERMLEQVLINLVRNSLQSLEYTDAGKIIIKAFTESARVKITISDNGPGIPDELLPQVFTPFFTTREHGSGIGLSLARQIMRLHRGSITARKGKVKGTIMELEF